MPPRTEEGRTSRWGSSVSCKYVVRHEKAHVYCRVTDFFESGTRAPFSTSPSHSRSSAHSSFRSTSTASVYWGSTSQPNPAMNTPAATLASASHLSMSRRKDAACSLYRVPKERSRVVILDKVLYCFSRGARGRSEVARDCGTEDGLRVGRK
jgi:hypothetical protein